MDRKFLFLFGVARSGTTPLTQIANANPKMAIGMERYLKLGKTGTLTPEHFTVEKFFDPDGPPTRRLNTSPAFREKFAQAEVIGDKIPRLNTGLPQIVATFPAPAFVGIVRDPIEVADSWFRQANSPQGAWAAWMSDTTSAVAQAAFWKAVLTEAPPERVLLVSYKTMLNDAEAMGDLARRIARFVGVDEAYTPDVIEGLGAKSTRVQAKARSLDPSASAFIEANYFRPLLDAVDAAGTTTVAALPADVREAAVRFYAERPRMELEALDNLIARGMGGEMIHTRRAKLMVTVGAPEQSEATLLDALDADPADAVAKRQLERHARLQTGDRRKAHALVQLAKKRLQEGSREVAGRLLAHASVDAEAAPRLHAMTERLRQRIADPSGTAGAKRRERPEGRSGKPGKGEGKAARARKAGKGGGGKRRRDAGNA